MLELDGSLHDDDNVYHYRPHQSNNNNNNDDVVVPKINHVSAGGHHLDADYPSRPAERGRQRPFIERASLMLSLGVGAGVVLVIVIIAAVSGVAWKVRRRRRKSVESLPPVVDSYALVPLSSRRPDTDPLPDVGLSSPGPRRTPPSAVNTYRPSRTRTPTPSTSVQQLEWQRMLWTADCDADDDVIDDVIGGGVPPLPPPPAFLLRAAAGSRRAPLVTDEILDGYHSGDNVDDDIERIGYVSGIGLSSRPPHTNRR